MIDDPEKLVMILRMGKKMRDLQKEYFKTREQTTLIASKKAEREFDAVMAEALT